MYITEIPAMTMTVGETFLILETMMMTAVGMREKMNALTNSPSCPVPTVNPMTIPRVTPNRAPDDTPVVYGSVRGFIMMLCITHPHTASPAPAMMPITMRGILSSMIA